MFLHRKLHISWMITVVGVGIVIGIILVRYADQRVFASMSWLIVGTILIALCVWERTAVLILLALVAGVVVGLWRGSLLGGELSVYNHIIGSTATIRGVVSEDAELDKRGALVMRLKNISVNGHALAGAVWVTSPTKLAVERSDRVTVHGKISEGFGTFNATMFEAQLLAVQRPEPGDIALRIRDWFSTAVRKVIPEPEASLGVGYLVGQRRALPPDLDQALKVTSLTHVVVASGYNLTILVRLARRLFEKKSKYLSALSSGGMIIAFIAITGLSPSMSRAGLVAGLSLLAWYYGRKFHPLVLLSLAAATTLLVNPGYGWNDLGWGLSFASFAGVMILAPLLQCFFFGDKKPGMLRQILGETLAAQIVTLPILIHTFGYMSNVAVFANLLILPLVPLAMLLVFIAGLGSLLFGAVAGTVAFPATTVLTYMIETIRYIAGLSWAQTTVQLSIFAVCCYYSVLVAVTVLLWRATKLNLRDSNIVE